MKSVALAALGVLVLWPDFASSKPHSNYSLIPHFSKRRQETLPQLSAESRQRPPGDRPTTWSSPPNIQWLDDPSPDANTNLLPVLYLMAPLVVTAMLMPIGATLIAAIFMLKANNPSPGTGSFKSLLFAKDEDIAPIYKIIEQNMMDLLKRVEEAILKYDSNSNL